MTSFKSIFFSLLISFLFIHNSVAQQTYLGADDKHTYMLSTKLLKNGDLVLLEFVTVCGDVNVKILKPNGEEESIFSSGFSKFRSFNELPDNNWLLVLITNATIDTPEPDIIHTIRFIDGDYTISSIIDDNTSIPLTDIEFSAVVNEDELVLAGSNMAYFTDFELSTITPVELPLEFQILKSFSPDEGFLYYKFKNEDAIKSTEDRFESDNLLSFNLGDKFRNIHYMGDYAIFQDVDEISAVFGLFGFEYLEQGKEIKGFRQHGQNLIYHTIDVDGLITLNKIYLDENQILQKDDFEIDVSGINDQYLQLHWDGDFKGISYHLVPLPRTTYDDLYESHNYILDYNLENFDLTSQSLDISIDDVEYDITNVTSYQFDVDLQLTITNNSDQVVQNLSVVSNGFDGAECFDQSYFEKLTQLNILPGESFNTSVSYPGFYYPDTDKDLCVYVVGANFKVDDDFENNIYCTTISKLTSTDDRLPTVGLEVYPNPAKDMIQLISSSPIKTFQVYNIHGQLQAVWELKSDAKEFDTSNLARGLYFILDQETKKKVIFSKI